MSHIHENLKEYDDMKVTVKYPKLTAKDKKRLSAEVTKKMLKIIKKG